MRPPFRRAALANYAILSALLIAIFALGALALAAGGAVLILAAGRA